MAPCRSRSVSFFRLSVGPAHSARVLFLWHVCGYSVCFCLVAVHVCMARPPVVSRTFHGARSPKPPCLKSSVQTIFNSPLYCVAKAQTSNLLHLPPHFCSNGARASGLPRGSEGTQSLGLAHIPRHPPKLPEGPALLCSHMYSKPSFAFGVCLVVVLFFVVAGTFVVLCYLNAPPVSRHSLSCPLSPPWKSQNPSLKNDAKPLHSVDAAIDR